MHKTHHLKLKTLFPKASGNFHSGSPLRFEWLDQAAAAKIATHLGLGFLAAPDQNNTCLANEQDVRPAYRTAVTAAEIFYYVCAIRAETENLENAIPYPSGLEHFWELVERGRSLDLSIIPIFRSPMRRNAVNKPKRLKMTIPKPSLSFWQIFNMNVGFLGIQFSFGLQQTAVNPIFSFLGAHPDDLPLLNLAGPVTGLIIQPIIGAISDKTWSPRWGRRKPFFLIGALLGSLCLFAFPYSPALWFAVGLLWILDVGNNMAMEPYRAFVGDKLPEKQMSFGYQMQSLFVGAGIVLANASIFLFQDWFGGAENISETATSIPRWLYYSFFIGAILSVSTILWSVLKTPEIPPSNEELEAMKLHNSRSWKHRVQAPFLEIVEAIKEMPKFMWKLSAVYLFQWYALFVYWQFIAPLFVESMGFDKSQALSQAAKMNTTYNLSTMVIALALVPLAMKFGGKKVYTASLFLTGIAMLSIPYIHDASLVLFPMVLFGIGWAAMMGIPYSMVSKIVPQERRGVYMGILNMMIVIPMGIQTLSFGFIVKNLLSNSAINAILFGGVFFIIAGSLALRLKEPKTNDAADGAMPLSGGH